MSNTENGTADPAAPIVPSETAAPAVASPDRAARAARTTRPKQPGETAATFDPFEQGRDFGDGTAQGGAGSKQFQITYFGGKKQPPLPNGKWYVSRPFLTADRARFGFTGIQAPDRTVRTWAATDPGVKECIAFFEANSIYSHNGKQNSPRALLGTLFSRAVCLRHGLTYDKGIGSNGGGAASGYVIGK
jgi:hypothetical protein